MEKNTVILSLDEYSDLRDFKTNIEKGNKVIVIRGRLSSDEKRYITSEQAVEEIAKINKTLHDDIEILFGKISKMKDDPMIFEPMKKMSIWEFIKWRRK